MADPAVRQDVQHWGDPQSIRRIDDRNQEERSDQHPEPRGDIDVHRYRPQKESEKEHGHMSQLEEAIDGAVVVRDILCGVGLQVSG